MRIALDTNRYVDFCKGIPEAVQIVRQAQEILLPLPVLAELRAGFLAGSQARKNERVLVHFLNSPRVEILYPDEQTTFHYARPFFAVAAAGRYRSMICGSPRWWYSMTSYFLPEIGISTVCRNWPGYEAGVNGEWRIHE